MYFQSIIGNAGQDSVLSKFRTRRNLRTPTVQCFVDLVLDKDISSRLPCNHIPSEQVLKCGQQIVLKHYN